MKKFVGELRVIACIGILGTIATLAAPNAAGATPHRDWVPAKAVRQHTRLSAFARGEAAGPITIAPSESGILADLTVLPGQPIAAGQVIAKLGGPRIDTAIAEAKLTLVSARAAQHSARIALSAEQRKLRQHLSTNQLVAQAASALATASAQAAIAEAKLAMLRQSTSLRSPLPGIVQTVSAANGDFLASGEAVATIRPSGATWLKAVFYNAEADDLQPGMTGIFTPADRGPPIAVRVRGPLGTVEADGGIPVTLAPATPIHPGIFGKVTFDLAEQTEILVPSQSLILDKGAWWVVLHTASGDHPVRVVPGAAEGHETAIESGLRPGDEVVVVNAYLLYHRGIAALYQPPD